jgi:Uma2 family endonuclease
MSIHIKPVKANELLYMPENGMRRELVSGELRETTLSGSEHGLITMRFSVPLGHFIQQNDLGALFAAETGFLLARDPDTVRAPDIAFVTRERLESTPHGSGYFPGAPDLAVEVISPSDTYSEIEEKVQAWLSAGCRLVVVVNPRNSTLKVYRTQTKVAVLTADDFFDGGDIIPGFQLLVRNLFV